MSPRGVGNHTQPNSSKRDNTAADDRAEGQCKAAVKVTIKKVVEQIHHFATNKNKFFTPQMEAIARRFGLKLDEAWNKMILPHLGRHPNQYHRFVLEGMETAAQEAGKDTTKFLELFGKYVVQPIKNNPELLRKAGWV